MRILRRDDPRVRPRRVCGGSGRFDAQGTSRSEETTTRRGETPDTGATPVRDTESQGSTLGTEELDEER